MKKEEIKIFAKTYEEGVIALSENVLNKKAASNVVLMPDTHIGKAAAIGFTAKSTDRIIPNVIGVDIGCGMMISKILGDVNLEELDFFIKGNIPSGFDPRYGTDSNKEAKMSTDYFNAEFITPLSEDFKNSLKPEEIKRFKHQLGSLGSGNHFIEVEQKDSIFKEKFFTVHSGSRGYGAKIAGFHQEKAARKAFETKYGDLDEKINKLTQEAKDADNTLKKGIYDQIKKLSQTKKDFKKFLTSDEGQSAYLEGSDAADYLQDMHLAVRYARYNRMAMLDTLNKFAPNTFYFDSVHNLIDEDGIIRKGATIATRKTKLIIPLNMRDGVIIAVGKGNKEWNNSAPHGAGRVLSRKKAFQTLNMEDFTEQMKDVFTTTANFSTLDESPSVYKDKDEIIEMIKPTVKILDILKPIYNFKAAEYVRKEKDHAKSQDNSIVVGKKENGKSNY